MHRIKEIIQFTGLNQKEFAEKIGISGNAITELLKGRSKGLSEQSLYALVKNFNVNINWLLTGEGEMFVSDMSEKTCQEEHAQYEKSINVNNNGLDVLDGGAENYPQVDDVEKISRTAWFRDLSDVKKFIIAGIDEISDEHYLNMTKDHINYEVDKERDQKKAAAGKKIQKGETA